MMFYRITANVTNMRAEGGKAKTEALFEQLRERTEIHAPDCGDFNYFFLSNFVEDFVTAGAVSMSKSPCAAEYEPLASKYEPFFRGLGIEYTNADVQEITGRQLMGMLHGAEYRGLIRHTSDVIDRFEDLQIYKDPRRRPDEQLLNGTAAKDVLLQKARDLLCTETLIPELERIYEKPSDGKVKGHPVHYLIQTDSQEVREQIIEILLTALYTNGRIQSSRYIYSTADDTTTFSRDHYSISLGGTVATVVALAKSCGEYVNKGNDIFKLVSQANYYQDCVLTIICLPRASEKQKHLLLHHLKNFTLVELREDMATAEQAQAYLTRKAQQKCVLPDQALYQGLSGDQARFLPAELDNLFVEWFSQRLKTSVYPQYAHLDTVRNKLAAEKPLGDAYSELHAMIGLDRAKEVIDQALDYAKAQKLFRERGMDQSRTALHMVFTGNPGTAKTTVARLLARIMRHNRLLSIGGLHEVGRADLVGSYVGWTAKIVKEQFEEAKGSVLLIDEAYSLLDDKEGLYGDEAINTIVQEMENQREDIVVIFAGYPDKMEQFLHRNPGLQSRIAFHVPFDDYSPEELCRITEWMAARKSLTLAPGVLDKLHPIFNTAVRCDNFGNGRFARNLLERAQMRQASRLLHMDLDRVTNTDVRTLLPEDFEAPETLKVKEIQRIGFVG